MNTSYATSIDSDSDGVLMAAAKGGDRQAFEALVLRHEQRGLAVAQQITNNREDAEDVAQESLHQAFLHLGDFREMSRFSTWLTRIVMNQAFLFAGKTSCQRIDNHSIRRTLRAWISHTHSPSLPFKLPVPTTS